MNITDWKLHSVVTDGEPLAIEGIDVWLTKWNLLKTSPLEVPHPSYPKQRHELRAYYMEADHQLVLFAAGELSNGVWCFYVPSKGQPSQVMKGGTVNERLGEFHLFDFFDQAIRSQNEKQARDILIVSGLSPGQATDTVKAILEQPGKYGYL